MSDFIAFLIAELSFWVAIDVTLLVAGVVFLLFVPGAQALGVILIAAAVLIWIAKRVVRRLMSR